MSNQNDDLTGQLTGEQKRLAALQLEEDFRSTIHPPTPDPPEGPAEAAYRAALPEMAQTQPLTGPIQLDNAAAFEEAAALQAQLDAEVASQIAAAGAEEETSFLESTNQISE